MPACRRARGGDSRLAGQRVEECGGARVRPKRHPSVDWSRATVEYEVELAGRVSATREAQPLFDQSLAAHTGVREQFRQIVAEQKAARANLRTTDARIACALESKLAGQTLEPCAPRVEVVESRHVRGHALAYDYGRARACERSQFLESFERDKTRLGKHDDLIVKTARMQSGV